jgi:tetratricopeptide (TPR) repeat protein
MRLPHEVSISQEEQEKQEPPNNLSNIEKIIQQLKTACENNNYEKQAKNYFALGNIYFKEKHDYINAIAIYNFALGLCQDEKKQISFKQSAQNLSEEIIGCIKFSEQQFLLSLIGKQINASDYKLDQAHKDYLKGIRDEAHSKLIKYKAITKIVELQLPESIERLAKAQAVEETLEEEKLSIQQIYQQISQQMRNFVKLLIEECKEELSIWRKPPNEEDYAIICFGSLARNEATPYSDLEFGILLREGTDSEENKEYFRVLTRLLNIKVINLAETTPRMQHIKELEEIGLLGRYSESPTKHGFCFDGNNKDGRKTPLGNMYFDDVSEDHKYELIQTPIKMAELQNDEWYIKDKHLSTVLMTVALINGNESLLEIYQKEIDLKLRMPININTITVTTSQLTWGQQRALESLQESFGKFEPRMGIHETVGHFFNAKYDLYRLPNMIIDHLSVYYYLINTNCIWERINRLMKNEVFNREGAYNLKVTTSKINEIRLDTYLKHDCQDNHVISLDRSNPQRNEEFLAKYFNIEQQQLFEIYYTLIPLYWSAIVFTDISDRKDRLIKYNFYIKNNLIISEIYRRLLNFNRAIIYIKQAIDEYRYKNDLIYLAFSLNNLGAIYKTIDRNEEAILCFKQAQEIRKKILSYDHPDIATTLNNLGNAYVSVGCYIDSIKFYEDALEIKKKILGDDHPSVAVTYSNLGTAHNKLSNYKEAENNYQIALKIQKKIFGSDHPEIATTLNNLGNVYDSYGLYDKAVECQMQAYEIRKKIFGCQHIDVVNSLINLGSICISLKKYEEAIEHYQDAINIQKKLFGYDNTNVAVCLNNIGAVYRIIGKRDVALKYLKESLIIQEAICGDESSYIAYTLNNLGMFFKEGCDYKQAVEYYLRSLKIQKKLYEFSGITNILNNLGICCFFLADYKNAIVYFQECLDITKKLFPDGHASWAMSLTNMGLIYLSLKEYKIAIRYLRDALTIQKKTLGLSHPDIATTLNGIAMVYKSLCDYEKSIAYYKNGLEMRKKYLHQDKDIALALNGLADVYDQAGDSQKSIELDEEALKLQKRFYNERHVAVATTLNNLGLAYLNIAKYEDAKKCFEDSIKIYYEIFGKDHPYTKRASNNLMIYLLRLGNFYFFRSNLEQAKKYYEMANVNFLDTTLHMQLVYKHYSDGQIAAAIEHYLILTTLSPNSTSVFHNLGCFFHIQAQQAKIIGDVTLVKEKLGLAEHNFRLALEKSQQQSEDSNNVCVEYANFLIVNNRILDAVPYLEKVVSSVQRSKSQLSYGRIERSTVSKELKEEIDAYGKITVDSHWLAYRFLITIYYAFTQEAIGNQLHSQVEKYISYVKNHIIHFTKEIQNNDIVSTQQQALLSKFLMYSHQELAYLYFICNNYLLAERHFKLALKLKATVSIYCNYGYLLFKQCRFEEAVENFLTVILSENNYDILIYTNLWKKQLDNYLQLEITEEKSLNVQSLFIAHYWLIQCLYKLGDLSLMQFYLDQLTELSSCFPTTLHYHLLSYSYLFIGDKERAQNYNAIALSLEDTAIPTVEQYNLDIKQRYLIKLTELVEKSPSYMCCRMLALIYRLIKNDKKAEEYFALALTLKKPIIKSKSHSNKLEIFNDITKSQVHLINQKYGIFKGKYEYFELEDIINRKNTINKCKIKKSISFNL